MNTHTHATATVPAVYLAGKRRSSLEPGQAEVCPPLGRRQGPGGGDAAGEACPVPRIARRGDVVDALMVRLARRDRERDELLVRAEEALAAGDVEQYRALYARVVRCRRRNARVLIAATLLLAADARSSVRPQRVDIRRAA